MVLKRRIAVLGLHADVAKLRRARTAAEYARVLSALRAARGRVREAAKTLGVDRRVLHKRLVTLELRQAAARLRAHFKVKGRRATRATRFTPSNTAARVFAASGIDLSDETAALGRAVDH